MPEGETSTAEAQAEVEEKIEEQEAEWQLTKEAFQAMEARQERIEASLNQLNSRLAQPEPETPPTTAVAVAEASPEAAVEPEALTVSEPPAEPEKPNRKSRRHRTLKWRKRKAS